MLPGWAQPLFYAVFIIAFGVGSSATWRGIMRGRSGPSENRPRDTQIEMMTLDGTAIKDAAKAVHALSDAMVRLGDIAERHLAELNAQRERDEDARIEKRGYERGLEEKTRRTRQPPVSRGQS